MRVVVLGGGYAAVWCYRALRRWLGDAVEVVVVAPSAEHVFHGFTGEVLDGELAPGLLASPLSECASKAEHVRGTAVGVDVARRTVTVETARGTEEVGYDHLVVATGARDRTEAVPGLAERGWILRSAGCAPALLAHLARLEAEPAVDERDARRRGTVVVVGAGLAGTEAAAALGRRYAGTRRVVLVSSAAVVVPAWRDRAALQRGLQRNLEEAGVELRLGARVARVDDDGVLLADGERIEAATVVSALGSAVPVLPGLEAFREPDGLLRVDECLRVTDRVWSAGDVAAVHQHGARVPKDALWAIRAGTRVGRNIARAARSARPRRFRFGGLGTVAAFAPGRAVAELRGVPLPAVVGWTVRAALFLWYVPSRRTAVRIALASLRPREVVAPSPIRIAQPVLVGLDGGLRPAERLRAAVAEPQEQRAAGA